MRASPACTPRPAPNSQHLSHCLLTSLLPIPRGLRITDTTSIHIKPGARSPAVPPSWRDAVHDGCPPSPATFIYRRNQRTKHARRTGRKRALSLCCCPPSQCAPVPLVATACWQWRPLEVCRRARDSQPALR
jgi:hypothetical protein